MGWPGDWGYLFWSLMHASGQVYRQKYPEALPQGVSEQIELFLNRLCSYLPCPACKIHCASHMRLNPPRFQSGTEYWQFTVDFHNHVNKHKKPPAMTITYEEAEALLTTQMSEFDWTLDHLEEAFLQDWWTALILTHFNYTTKPDNPPQESQDTYREFLAAACFIVPFGHKVSHSDPSRTCCELMLEQVYASDFLLDSRDHAFEALTNLHNSVCEEFGVIRKTIKEMKAAFGQRFEMKHHTELTRAAQIRDEDMKKMMAMQKELDQYRAGRSPELISAELAASGKVSGGYQTATIALSVILGSVLIVLFAIFVVYRFKLCGSWRLVRNSRVSTDRSIPLKT